MNAHRVHVYEKAFLLVSAFTLVLFMGALVYASDMKGMHLPGAAQRIDPAKVYKTAPFTKPGVHELADGSLEAVVVAQAWLFLPNELHIPVNREVTFVMSSADVIHGFEVAGTSVNAMLIPGQVTRLTHTFHEAGEYRLVCHEYCGLGHHTMFGKVIVE